MKTNIVAPAGGLAILAGGLALAFYTATSAPTLKETKSKTVQKYIAQAQKALAKGETKEAEKLIKRAIVVDPKSKEALNEFKKIALSGCSSLESKATPTESKKATATKPTPAKEEAEADDEMGCI